jgi:hypothetical protein
MHVADIKDWCFSATEPAAAHSPKVKIKYKENAWLAHLAADANLWT